VSRRGRRQCGQPEGSWTAQVVGGRADPSSAGVGGHCILQGVRYEIGLKRSAGGYAYWDAAISASPSMSMAVFRMSTLRTLPLAVIGKSSTIRT
jgi:hypothetical protein